MKIPMMQCQTLLVFCFVVISTAEEEYENKLTKLWSLSSASNSDGSAVLNVTSASIVINPSSYSSDSYVPIRREAKVAKLPQKYAFKPRAIPLRAEEDRSVYYSQDNVNKYKSEILFPGNYFPIAKEKSENATQDSVYNPLSGGPFHPKTIPLIRSQELQKRSLDEDEEPIIQKPRGFTEQVASRRSLSEILGVEDTDDDDYEDGEYEVEEGSEIVQGGLKSKGTKGPKGHKVKKPKKLKKYMLPLLLAYKMKYFALVPVMIGGLILLVGATGLAGFFFALFAAVMALQKGGAY